MPKAARHLILYDVERWRKYRTWLLLPGTVFAMSAVFLTVLKPAAGGAFGYALLAVGLYAVATSLWTRQHFTYLVCEEGELVIHALAASRRLRNEDIERARLIRLSAVFHRPERRRLLPRPADRWLATEAISLRLRDSVDLRALRRVAGPRCVVDDMLVVPVVDAAGLFADIVKRVSPPRPVAAAAGSRRKARRR